MHSAVLKTPFMLEVAHLEEDPAMCQVEGSFWLSTLPFSCDQHNTEGVETGLGTHSRRQGRLRPRLILWDLLSDLRRPGHVGVWLGGSSAFRSFWKLCGISPFPSLDRWHSLALVFLSCHRPSHPAPSQMVPHPARGLTGASLLSLSLNLGLTLDSSLTLSQPH